MTRTRIVCSRCKHLHDVIDKQIVEHTMGDGTTPCPMGGTRYVPSRGKASESRPGNGRPRVHVDSVRPADCPGCGKPGHALLIRGHISGDPRSN